MKLIIFGCVEKETIRSSGTGSVGVVVGAVAVDARSIYLHNSDITVVGSVHPFSNTRNYLDLAMRGQRQRRSNK